MPAFALNPGGSVMPVAGLIARGAQVSILSAKLRGRKGLMLVQGDTWLAAFSLQGECDLPWLPDPPIYLYALAPGTFCQSGFEPDIPAPVLPSLIKTLTSYGTVALTSGPEQKTSLWDFNAALPIDRCNVGALVDRSNVGALG